MALKDGIVVSVSEVSISQYCRVDSQRGHLFKIVPQLILKSKPYFVKYYDLKEFIQRTI